MGFLRALTRLLRGLLAAIITVLVLSLLAAGALLYLSATGRDLTAVRTLARGTGRLLSGQRTDSMILHVRAIPEQGRFSASAELEIHSLEAGRRRFFFLLNEGLELRRVRGGTDEDTQTLAAYRLGPLLVIELDEPVGAEQPVTLHLDYDGRPASGLLGAKFVFEAGRIRLPTDSFWYPNDVQSSSHADVTVSLPRELTLVHNGEQQSETDRGALRSTRWKTARPIAGMALIAGHYEHDEIEADGIRYRLFFAVDERLDREHVLGLMAEADGILRRKLGPSGFNQVTAFISHRLRRAFNDGSGLIGLSDRYFQRGDYGFGLLAHELAHNWWGATVAEKWLTPGTGGEWIVEGFAEFSSMIAAEEKYGSSALTLRLTEAFFDPARQRPVAEMSVLDNALAEDVSRDTIYRKGAYVAFMLRQIVGAEKFYEALSLFSTRFRHQQASDIDVQKTLEGVSGLDLEPFFEDWVRSDRLADLAIESTKDGALEITNHGSARIAGDLELWKFRVDASQPEVLRLRVGDRIEPEPFIDHMILDPQLHWADVARENNRFPRRSDAVGVAASASARVLVTSGEPFHWARTTVREVSPDAGGHTWDFNRGFAQPVSFGNRGETAVAAYADLDLLPSVVTLAADGSRRTLGHGSTPALSPDGTVFAAARDRIIKLVAEADEKTIAAREGSRLSQPQPSPDGTQLAYLSYHGNDFEIRRLGLNDGSDVPLLSWHGDPPRYVWSADGQRLYVALGVGWDWQIWEVQADEGSTQPLATGAVTIAAMSLSPDGRQLAFTAVPELEYPLNRHRLYVQPLGGGEVRTFDLGGDAGVVCWTDDDTLLVIMRHLAAGNSWVLPARRSLLRVRLSSGAVEEIS
jgi:hypothetical protein